MTIQKSPEGNSDVASLKFFITIYWLNFVKNPEVIN